MTQKEMVIQAMEKNGGYATFKQLNQTIDFSSWKTKTPDASVRQIVQINKEFFRIQPGLWALTSKRGEVLKRFDIVEEKPEEDNEFTHAYFQGIIAEIGNLRKFNTYVPPQDKNKKFLERKLSDVTTLPTLGDFTYPNIKKYANTVDVVWINERKMPCAMYEVEHSTNIKNSLNKFYELQDFRAKFCIVAPKERRRQFDDIISASIYKPIATIVKFVDYDTLIKQYEKETIVINDGI